MGSLQGVRHATSQTRQKLAGIFVRVTFHVQFGGLLNPDRYKAHLSLHLESTSPSMSLFSLADQKWRRETPGYALRRRPRRFRVRGGSLGVFPLGHIARVMRDGDFSHFENDARPRGYQVPGDQTGSQPSASGEQP